MNQPNESLLNNPTHPCGFCAEPVSITKQYCDEGCKAHDEVLKKFLSITESVIPDEFKKEFVGEFKKSPPPNNWILNPKYYHDPMNTYLAAIPPEVWESAFNPHTT